MKAKLSCNFYRGLPDQKRRPGALGLDRSEHGRYESYVTWCRSIGVEPATFGDWYRITHA